jgi:hypothetical protein
MQIKGADTDIRALGDLGNTAVVIAIFYEDETRCTQ